jgi:hypothetical protein
MLIFIWGEKGTIFNVEKLKSADENSVSVKSINLYGKRRTKTLPSIALYEL